MGNGYEGSGGEGGRQSEPEEGSLREATLTWRTSEGLRGGKEGGKRGQGERTGRGDMEGGRGRQGGREGGRGPGVGGGGVATVQRPRITHHAKIGCEISGATPRLEVRATNTGSRIEPPRPPNPSPCD